MNGGIFCFARRSMVAILGRLLGAPVRDRFIFLLCLQARLNYRLSHLLPRLHRQPVMRIQLLKLLKRLIGTLFIVEIVFIDFADPK